MGWANLSVQGGQLHIALGLVPGVRQTGTFTRSLDRELDRWRAFLGAD